MPRTACRWPTWLLVCGLLAPMAAVARTIPEPDSKCHAATRIASGGAAEPTGAAVVGEILVRNVDVFDPTAPGEDRWAYRLANRLHWTTRVPVICSELLFAPEIRTTRSSCPRASVVSAPSDTCTTSRCGRSRFTRRRALPRASTSA